ncbi:MAG: hypothetical protein HUU38_29765, partial [Anaerolineales bacterium]|nr:hypothetical protein [Anaerolineales bacterium]
MRPKNWHMRLIQLLAVVGLGIALYLYLYHQGTIAVVCGTGRWDNCGAVSGPQAPYSSIGQLPVALIGLVGYSFIFVLTWLQEWWGLLDRYMPQVMVGVVDGVPVEVYLPTAGLSGGPAAVWAHG